MLVFIYPFLKGAAMGMKSSSLLHKKREEIIKIAKAHGATSLRVFGSYSRGEEQPGSDIDLIVELETGRSLLDVIAIKQEIEDIVHAKVDVVTEASLSPYIREEILQEAVVLWKKILSTCGTYWMQ